MDEQSLKTKEVLIEEIISAEFTMFQEVQNIGGRASCQDQFNTFHIMRLSQFANWTDEMIEVYHTFIHDAAQKDINVVSEKYARMMEYSDNEYYRLNIEPFIPEISQEKRALIDEIVGILVDWEKDFCINYPKLAAVSRPTTSAGDDFFTSVETYNRGELSTYPEELIKLFREYLDALKNEGKSFSIMTRKTMVEQYGYESLEECESRMK